MPALAIPAFWAAVGGTAAAGAGIYAAYKQSDAAHEATAASTASNAAALDFEKQQAAADQARFEATQRANYDQWAARQSQLSSLGEMVGLPGRTIPSYVPTTAAGTPGAPTTGGPTALSSAPNSAAVSLVQQAINKGLSGQAAIDYINSVQPGAAVVVPAGSNTPAGKIAWYDKGNGAGKFQMTGPESWEIKTDPALGQGWIYNPLTGGSAPSGAPPVGSLASIAKLYPNVSGPGAMTPTSPTLNMGGYAPGSLASLLTPEMAAAIAARFSRVPQGDVFLPSGINV